MDRTRVAYLEIAGHFFCAATFSLKCKKSAATHASFTAVRRGPPLPMGHASADEVDPKSCEETSW